ncbi:hypothetical protein ECDEC12E_2640 [Escherichia coli DEC12E]|nr:hypothetical protein ECDEC12E_2640 [Escherichia coli DEC12E]
MPNNSLTRCCLSPLTYINQKNDILDHLNYIEHDVPMTVISIYKIHHIAHYHKYTFPNP